MSTKNNYPYVCPTCSSTNFQPSILGPHQCTYCDGTADSHSVKPPIVVCQYCYGPALRVSGKTLHLNEDQAKQVFYYCAINHRPAYVGTSASTGKPLGILANLELAALHELTHNAFDPLWQSNKRIATESELYATLADHLKIHESVCHISMFSITQCNKTILWCENQHRTVHL